MVAAFVYAVGPASSLNTLGKKVDQSHDNLIIPTYHLQLVVSVNEYDGHVTFITASSHREGYWLQLPPTHPLFNAYAQFTYIE